MTDDNTPDGLPKDWHAAYLQGISAREMADKAKPLPTLLPPPKVPNGASAADNHLRFPRDIKFNPGVTDLVKGVLPRGVVSLLYGETSVGKTFAGIDLSYHLAHGRDWHGKRVRNAVPVLLIPYEGVTGLDNRMLAATAEHGDPGTMLAVLTLPAPLSRGKAGDAGEQVIIAEAQKLADINGQPTGVIIIDTVSWAMAPDDDGSNQDAGALLARMGRIRDATGATVIGIHHPGKDPTRGMRGGYVLKGNSDVVLRAEDRGDVKVVVIEKGRDGPTGDLFAFRFKRVVLGYDDDGEERISFVIEPAELPQREAKKRGRPKGTSDDVVAMQSLELALAEVGKVPPASNHIPSGTVAVTFREWGPYAGRKNVLDTSTEQKRQTERLKRIARRLDAINQAGMWGEYVWKIK